MEEAGMGAAANSVYVEQSALRLWLVRHGETCWHSERRFCGHSDIGLTVRGRAQVRGVAWRLRTRRIVAIYSSDLRRARETTNLLARVQSSATLNFSPAWREINFGAWEGLTYEQIAQRAEGHLDFFSNPVHCAAPGGESLADVVERVRDGLGEIVRAHAAAPVEARGDVAIVSHGGPLRALLCGVLGIAVERQWQFRLDPGSLSAIDLFPTSGAAFPPAILIFLNEQRPRRPRRSPSSLSHPGSVERTL